MLTHRSYQESFERFIDTISIQTGISIPADSLLRDIETRSGLLIERSIDVLGFSHLTLQEYLVAKQIQMSPDKYSLITDNFDNQEWREVTLLYGGLIDDATTLVNEIMKIDSFERLILAGYCIGDAKYSGNTKSQEIIKRLISNLEKRDDYGEESANVLATIAEDFTGEPVKLEQRLSMQLLNNITNEASLNIKLHSIAILGKARITYALPTLVTLLKESNNEIGNAASDAMIDFGNLALAHLEENIDSGLARGEIEPVLKILSGINTGLSARLLMKLYAIEDEDIHIRVSFVLSQMLTNPFIESDLKEIEAQSLPQTLLDIVPDRNGWKYKDLDHGSPFYALDAKLKKDTLSLLQKAGHTGKSTHEGSQYHRQQLYNYK